MISDIMIKPTPNSRSEPNVSLDSVETGSNEQRIDFNEDEDIEYAIPADGEVSPENDSQNSTQKQKQTRKNCCERHPRIWLLISLLIYPAIFIPMVAAGGAWPLQLSPIEDLTQSSVEAFIDLEIMTNIQNQIRSSTGDFDSSTTATDSESEQQHRRLQDIHRAKIEIFYATSGPNAANSSIFDYISNIREIESGIVPDTLCPPPSPEEIRAYESLGRNAGDCAAMYPYRDSPINYFYSTFVANPRPGTKGGRLNDGKATGPSRNASLVYKEWLETKNARFLPRGFLGSDILSLTRSTFFLQASDRGQLNNYIRGELLGYLESKATSVPGMVMSYYHTDLLDQELNNAVTHDTIMAVVGMIVVAVIMFVLLDFSLFLTIFALIALAFALPMAYAFFTVVIGIRQIFSLSFLSLYVLFGVGSDCCFLYADELNPANPASGMAQKGIFEGWKRAAMATFVTMSTTAVSFFANAASPISVVKEWGIFMGLVVSFAWLTTATIFPFAILSRTQTVSHRRASGSGWLGTVFARSINKCRYLLLFITVALALTSCLLTFLNNALAPNSNSVPQFFDPVSSNLGRVFELKDEFDWVTGGSTVGSDGQTETTLECDEPEFVLDSTKTHCVEACPEPCGRLRWDLELTPGGGFCPCAAPQSQLLDYASAIIVYPRNLIRLSEKCSECNPNAHLQFEFASPEGDFTQLIKSLRNVRRGQSFNGFAVVNHSLMAPESTRTPTLTTTSPTIRQTISPTFAPTKQPTNQPTNHPTSRSPTRTPTKLSTQTPTKNTPTKTSAPVRPTIDAPTPPAPPTTLMPTSKSPTAFPTQSPTPEPSKAPTRTPSANPTTSRPSLHPTTSAPSKSPTASPSESPTPMPTDSPISLPRCLNDCSDRGICDADTRTCQCLLGFTGKDCSETIDIEISDGSAESVQIGYGLEKGVSEGKLSATFNLTVQNQLKLLGICATLCAANNESFTAQPASRCVSFPIQQMARNLTKVFRTNFGFVPKADLVAMGFRRLTHCGITELAEAALSRGETFPIQSHQVMDRVIRNMSESIFQSGHLGKDRSNNIRFVRLEMTTTFSSKTTSASKAREKYWALKDFLAQFDDDFTMQQVTNGIVVKDSVAFASVTASPSSPLGDAVISSSLFARTETELSTIDGFVNSWLITTCVAVAAIAVYTRNLLMAILAGLSMSCVIVCVFGLCFFLLGWTFGLIEAVGLTIVVGLTVDYAAHLTYAFSQSKAELSKDRLADAVHAVGLAIVSSALTTIGGCGLLFAATILPFKQFGALVCATIILNIFYSFAFLSPMLIILGNLPRNLYRLLCGSKTSSTATAEEDQQQQ